jgi:hypothetical protein
MFITPESSHIDEVPFLRSAMCGSVACALEKLTDDSLATESEYVKVSMDPSPSPTGNSMGMVYPW